MLFRSSKLTRTIVGVRSTRGCACGRIESARCESSSWFGVNLVTEGNCVTVRWGGKQLEVNCQSVTSVNSIRPSVVASLPSIGEAQMTLLSRHGDGNDVNRSRGKPCASNHTIAKGRQGVVGDGMVGRFNNVKQGDLDDLQAS